MINLICDIDGVLWTSSKVLPRVTDGLRLLNDERINTLFVSNNSFIPVSVLEARISDLGFPAFGHVITSPMVVASCLPVPSRVCVIAGDGTLFEMKKMGHEICELGEDPEYLVVGLRQDFDYRMMSDAALAIRRGAQLIGTNDDPAYPTEHGLLPGGGAILAAIATASETEPKIFGKPYSPMVDYLKQRIGNESIHYMIGDRTDHDGLFANKLGAKFLNVISEATSPTQNNQVSQFKSLLNTAEYVINRLNSTLT